MKRYRNYGGSLIEAPDGEWIHYSDLRPPQHSEMDEEDEIVNGHWVPGGTLLLEPRDMYDKALVGSAHQAGISIAVYSRAKTLAAMQEGPDGMDYDDAVEMYEFNTSGCIGPTFPVFMLDDEDPPL